MGDCFQALCIQASSLCRAADDLLFQTAEHMLAKKYQVCSIAQLLVCWPKLKSHEDKSLYLMFVQPEKILLQSWASVKNSCTVQSARVQQDII